jgi:hypothetical protein
MMVSNRFVQSKDKPGESASTTFIRTGDMGALLYRQLFITGAQHTTTNSR